MKKLLIPSLCCISFAGLYVFFGEESKIMKVSEQRPSEPLFVLPADTPVGDHQQQVEFTLSQQSRAEIAPTQEMEHVPQVYGEVAMASPDAKLKLAEAGVLPSDLANAHFIEFDLATLRKLEQGDTFDMTIPHTQEQFSAEVNKTTVFPNGDKSVHALVIGGDGRFHNTVLTVGENAVYGQFTVASGNYTFESKDQHGWIAAKRDLYKNHIEHTPNYESGETQTDSPKTDDPFSGLNQ